MLTILQKGYPPIEYHVGEPNSLKPIGQATVMGAGRDVPTIIEADGDELAYILRTFKNIPITDAPVQRWHGETALYILLNWRK